MSNKQIKQINKKTHQLELTDSKDLTSLSPWVSACIAFSQYAIFFIALHKKANEQMKAPTYDTSCTFMHIKHHSKLHPQWATCQWTLLELFFSYSTLNFFCIQKLHPVCRNVSVPMSEKQIKNICQILRFVFVYIPALTDM